MGHFLAGDLVVSVDINQFQQTALSLAQGHTARGSEVAVLGPSAAPSKVVESFRNLRRPMRLPGFMAATPMV
jgi:hypothetical protein